MPPICQGPGPATGDPQLDSAAIARCVTASAHCAALATLDMIFDDPLSALEAQHPDNLHYALGGAEGHTFASCVEHIDSTTTTLDTPTTTLGTPTTTLSAPTTTTTLPSAGALQLVITEIMSNPAAQSDAAGEYFEVLNAGTTAVDLDGLIVADLGSDAFTVDGPLPVAAGRRVVFGKSETAAGGIVDFVYGSRMSLTNSSDEIVLMVGTDVIDQVVYDGSFPSGTGRAIELVGAQSAAGNDDPTAWCVSDSPLADGDFGTPRAAVGPCLP
ncbi:MAG: lamin tail domain-containing protein [Myxococcales bacterium]|nr:MAG: lamin tail domain-containing protein [Myxococcales bacterium]